MSIDSLTAIVGSGGTGKSSFLRALEWFFAGGSFDVKDLREESEGEEISVAVTFCDLNETDRAVLGRYSSGHTTTLTRSWRPGEQDKLSGSALVYEGFDEIRKLTGVARRQKYAELVTTHGTELGLGSPAPSRVAEADAAMEQWERENPERCALRTEDARHLFGFAGDPRLADRYDFVLIGAADHAEDALGTGKSSPLSRLLATVGELDPDATKRIADLQESTYETMLGIVSAARSEDRGCPSSRRTLSGGPSGPVRCRRQRSGC